MKYLTFDIYFENSNAVCITAVSDRNVLDILHFISPISLVSFFKDYAYYCSNYKIYETK